MTLMEATKKLSIVQGINQVELVKRNADAHAQTVLDFVTAQQERVMENVKSFLGDSSLTKRIDLSVPDETSHKLVEEKLVNDIKLCETHISLLQEKAIKSFTELEEQQKKVDELMKKRQGLIDSWKEELSDIEALYHKKYSKIDRFIVRYCDNDTSFSKPQASNASFKPKFKTAELLKAAHKYSLANNKKPKRGKVTKNEKDTIGPYDGYNQSQKSVLYRIHLIQLAYVLDCIYTCQKLEDIEAKKTEELQTSFIKAQTEINSSRR